MLTTLILLWININNIPVGALYFAKTSEELLLPVGCTSDSSAFYEGYVLRSGHEPAEVAIHFRLEEAQGVAGTTVTSVNSSSNVYSSTSELIGIAAPPGGQPQAFQLFARRQLNATKTPLNVIICAKNQDNRPHQAPCLHLKIRFVSNINFCNDQSARRICFGQSASSSSSFNFTVHENSPVQSIGRLLQSSHCRAILCPSSPPIPVISYTLQTNSSSDEQIVKLDESDGVFQLAKVINREEIRNISFVVKCEVLLEDGSIKRAEKKGRLVVKDENEHGPIVINSPPVINFTLDEGIDKLFDSMIAVKDGDPEPSPYLVEILDDVKGFFNVTIDVQAVEKFDYNPLEFSVIRARLHQNRPIEYDGNSYTFRIRFEDLNLVNPEVSREAMVYVVLQKHVSPMGDPSILDNIVGQEFEAQLSLTSANHSRVAVTQMLGEELRERSGVRFFLEASTPPVPLPFDVTPFYGILYVNDTRALRRLNASEPFRLKLSWRMRDSVGETPGISQLHVQPLGYIWINIQFTENSEEMAVDEQCDKERMCSFYNNPEICMLGCGIGATKGVCQWRAAGKSLLSPSSSNFSYATCSPDIITCPDNKCDELEQLFHYLCPQDCVLSKYVYGGLVGAAGSQSHGIPRGSSGVCTCSYTAQCICDSFIHSKDNTSPWTKSNNSSVNITHYKPHISATITKEHSIETSCGWECALAIGAGAAMFIGVTISVVFCCYCRTGRKLRGGHKFPGSLASLPAIPSDYVDERSSSVVSQNLLVANEVMNFPTKLSSIDSKWEFPRSRLILEQTLGEGEFGRVVKAKALNILPNQPGYTTVAVKMLKSNGSSSEQDLMSEFNLLKEVCHPNVIRLLGICIDKEGPLCIIVEYAEFGALRTFLRKSRRLEFKSCTSDDSGVDSMANGVQSEPQNWSDYQVSSRELLSFCWQISKGMEYLSVIKLVHRDLAARNILVAVNKAVKISDFGMTRDVYEGDTYFKKSMGRVPVKWLAIESLLDHIYTTKSDVWSFGIVLWEIVTLGAAPYPGVAPERLYHLLKSGYRMEKPDNCSDELYDIMKRCWRESPSERPTFAELTKIFDQMLQANVEYLDLGVNIVHNLTYFEDIPPHTETIDEEGDDSEMGYGSWNALPNDDDEQYLASNPPRVTFSTNHEKEELLAKPQMMPKVISSSVDEHTV